MRDAAYKYRAEILRAVFGPTWHETKVDDLRRLNQYVNRLVECEKTESVLRAKGYGIAGMSLLEVAASVPESVKGILRGLFRSRTVAQSKPGYPDLGEVHDTWTSK